jgi:CHAT domain-containing protein
MYAGAARVLSSLWNVDDEATAYLMSIFYSRAINLLLVQARLFVQSPADQINS